MVFSKESCRVIFEMGNVELIELMKSSIQCSSCLHHVFDGTLLCKCGKLMKPDQDVMNWIEEAFEILKAPCYRTCMIVTRSGKCGPNPWQQNHHMARDALRSATKDEKTFTSIWDRWQNDDWSDAWVRYLDHIVHFNIHRNAPQPQRERYVNLLHLRGVDENKQTGPLWQRPGYWEAKKDVSNLQKSKREGRVPYIPVSDRKRDYKSTWNG